MADIVDTAVKAGSTNPAAWTAATKVLNEPALTAVSTISAMFSNYLLYIPIQI